MATAPIFSEAEHTRISDAIRAAEAKTSGEIVCVVTRQSEGYFFSAAAAALVFVLVAGLVAAVLLEHWWLAPRLPVFAGAQMLAGVTALLALKLAPRLRLALTPKRARFRAAHANAVRQFLGRNIHRTQRRTGVLVFVSLAERYACVLADSGINAQVPQARWNGIVAGLVARARGRHLAQGIVEAVAEAGALLAAHFPPVEPDRNELSDHLVEL